MNMRFDTLYGFKIQNPFDVVKMVTPDTPPPMLLGMRVFENSNCVRIVERRVTGGYMNRWLIRKEVMVPTYRIVGNAIYIHPDLMAELCKMERAA